MALTGCTASPNCKQIRESWQPRSVLAVLLQMQKMRISHSCKPIVRLKTPCMLEGLQAA
jgi:hypothetical protein